MKKVGIHTKQEREKNIIASGKEVLLQSTRERILNEMKPNEISWHHEWQKEYRKTVGEYLQTVRCTDPFWLWVIRGFPRIFPDGVSGIAASFTVESWKKYVFKTIQKHVYDGEKAVLQPEAVELEAMILDLWSNAGVSVPDVVAQWVVQGVTSKIDIPYYIMEFVQPVMYEKELDWDGKKKDFDIAAHLETLYPTLTRELVRMHTIPFPGYGNLRKDPEEWWKGQFSSLKLAVGKWNDRVDFFDYIAHRWWLDDDAYSKLMLSICTFVEWDLPNWWVLLHNDVGLYNTIPLDESHLVVIDPIGKVGHPYEDVVALVRRVFVNYREHDVSYKVTIAKKVLEEYATCSGKPIYQNILVACMFADCMKRLAGLMTDARMWTKVVERGMMISILDYVINQIQNSPMTSRCIDRDELGNKISTDSVSYMD